jgi:alcohol dehydrogenase
VIEVAGSPESLQAAIDLVRPGGTIAAIGVFSTESFNLNLSDVFLRDISLHMNGFANVQPFVQGAADLLQSGKIHADDLFTHDFKLRDIDKAYVIGFTAGEKSRRAFRSGVKITRDRAG